MDYWGPLGRRRTVTALAATVIALGAGYLMQVVLADRTPLATVDKLPGAASGLRSVDQPAVLPLSPEATLAQLAPPQILPDRVKKPVNTPPATWDDARMSPFGFECGPTLTLKVQDAAMIIAQVFAPCDPGQNVTIRHGALEIDLMTDSFGRAQTVVPALVDSATVTAVLERQTVKADADLPDAGAYSRVVLVWEGEQVFRMNAYELGATRGESGHIRAGAAKTAKRAMRGTGGFLVAVGDGSGRSAEIYTFPTGYSPLRGVVELVVEADVTEANCEQLVQATALQTGPLGGMTSTDVRVTLPGCDRIGDVMELKNLLQDMRLAGR